MAFVADLPFLGRFAGSHPFALAVTILGYAVTSLGILIHVFSGRRLAPSALLVVHSLDLLWPSLVCLFTGCAASPFLFLFLLTLIATPYRRNALDVVLVTLSSILIVLTETVVATLPWFSHLHLLLRPLTLGPLFLLLIAGGFLAWSAFWTYREQKAYAAQSILRHLRSDAAVEKNLEGILPAILDVFEAKGIVLVLRNSSTWRVFQWGASQMPEAQAHVRNVPSSEELRYFWPMPEGSRSVACSRGQKDYQWLALDQRGTATRINSAAFRPELLWDQPFQTLLATSFQFGSEWSGRLFVMDAPCSAGPEASLRLLQHVVAEVGPAVYNFYLWEHTRVRVRAHERQRLARDLHDGVLQSLIATEMQLEVLARQSQRRPAQAYAAQSLDQTQTMLRAEIRRLRMQIQQLRSVSAPRQVLRYMEQMLENFQRDTGIRASFACNVEEAEIPRKLRSEIVHIIQEALSNVRKHSRARSVEVRLTARHEAWEIVIQDDGLGFGFSGKLSLSQLDAAHQGPRVIRERVNLANGEMTLESYPNRGTRLKIRFAESA
jgi:signal transduction histidine kinase